MKIINADDYGKYRNIWIIAEPGSAGGIINPVTHEIAGRGRQLADLRGAELWILVTGNLGGRTDYGKDFFYADRVVIADDSRVSGFHDETESALIKRLIDKYRPEVVLFSATARGRSLAPRVAVLSDAGLTADCTSLDIEKGSGNLLQTRPAFGGNIIATIKSEKHRPQMATVRPGVMKNFIVDRSSFNPGFKGPDVIIERYEEPEILLLKKILGTEKRRGAVHSIAESEFIISGGRGMGSADNFRIIEKFASLAGGAPAASRGAVDAGWVPYSYQIGQTGQTVQAKCYIACGISGQIQHLVGMQACEYIIAINRDPGAPIMKMADVAVTGDAVEILTKMSDQLECSE